MSYRELAEQYECNLTQLIDTLTDDEKNFCILGFMTFLEREHPSVLQTIKFNTISPAYHPVGHEIRMAMFKLFSSHLPKDLVDAMLRQLNINYINRPIVPTEE